MIGTGPIMKAASSNITYALALMHWGQTPSPPRNTWSDLMSVYDDSVGTFWHFLNSRFVEDWLKDYSTVEVVWRE